MSLWRSLFGWTSSKEKEVEPSKRQVKLDAKLAAKYGLQSGECTSPDGEVAAAWATMRGKRPMQEDTVHCQFHKDEQSGQVVGAFGVFDGHGGPVASRFVCDHLFNNLLAHHTFEADLFKAVEEAYCLTDKQYLQLDAQQLRDDGCTAVTAVLVGRRLVTAHVGDSRAVLSNGKGAVALSSDHKPNRDDERGRIEDAGASVVWAGTWRVGGVLAVSRSFGNRMLKQFIIPHPEIREDHLQPANECLVLASDGLWDAVSNEEAARLALRHRSQGAEAAARALVAEAYVRGSQDNITAVVVFFQFAS